MSHEPEKWDDGKDAVIVELRAELRSCCEREAGNFEEVKTLRAECERLKADRDDAWHFLSRDRATLAEREAQLAELKADAASVTETNRRIEDALQAALREREAEAEKLKAECASISAEFGLPPTIRPAEGEIARMRKEWAEARAALAGARKEALEEAAKVLNELGEFHRRTANRASGYEAGRDSESKAEAYEHAEDAIRALASDTGVAK